MAASKKKLKTILIHLHGHDGDHEGFEVEHEYHQGGMGSYEPPTSAGVMEHHGDVMSHVHDFLKEHGSSGAESQEKAEGGEAPGDCPLCGVGESETKKAKLGNVSKHGYEKHTANDSQGGYAKKGGSGHSAKHPGFKAVQSKIASKEGLSEKAAGAILASRSRGASPSAHKANPRLGRVRG